MVLDYKAETGRTLLRAASLALRFSAWCFSRRLRKRCMPFMMCGGYAMLPCSRQTVTDCWACLGRFAG
jgi:hypothetical protein